MTMSGLKYFYPTMVFAENPLLLWMQTGLMVMVLVLMGEIHDIPALCFCPLNAKSTEL